MKKLMNCLRNFFLFIVTVLIICISTHQILTFVEKKQNPTIGQYVTVNKHQMSLKILGNGEHTIVLLPGLGTTAPILDFMPLAKDLAKENRVVIVEPFGYGWSDITSDERTLENEVDEIRTALHSAELNGPFILMPHSLSGLHAIYYANTYPDEISGIIGIDCTLPQMADYFEEEVPAPMSLTAGQLVNIGVMRLITYFEPDNFTSDNRKDIYSLENITLQKYISSWKAQNKNVIDQMNHINDSITTTHDMTFESDLPVLLFTTDDSEKETREDGKTNISFCETYISNPSLQRVIPLNGPHYLHWTCKDEICFYVHEFMLSCLP